MKRMIDDLFLSSRARVWVTRCPSFFTPQDIGRILATDGCIATPW